jgi:predicted phosphate transport protein (TIGR00153 family)
VSLRLIPRDIKFYDLFEAGGTNLAAAGVALRELVLNYDKLDERIRDIQALEKEGDRIDREIGRRLEDAFVAPFDREDIHTLSGRLDDVLDYIQAVAESLAIYDIQAPTDDCRELARILADEAAELGAALHKLSKVKGTTEHLEKVHDLEHRADAVSRAAIGRLFRDKHEALEVIKWREIYLEMENAIDAAEDAAEAIERMIHKRV